MAKKLLMFTAALTLLAIGVTIPTIMLMECKNPSEDPVLPTTLPPLPELTEINTEFPVETTNLDTTGSFTTDEFTTQFTTGLVTGFSENK